MLEIKNTILSIMIGTVFGAVLAHCVELTSY